MEIDATMSNYAAFGIMERNGWSDPARASGYVKLFASASDQLIPGLLDAVDAKANLKVLDLCCVLHASASSSAFASFRSSVSKPSVNQP